MDKSQSTRRLESMVTRKRILKSTLNPHNKEDLFESLSDTGNVYLEKLARLNSFKEKSRLETKSQTQKLEWNKELMQLAKAKSIVESEISSLIEVIILHTPGEELATNLAHEFEKSRLSIKDFERNSFSQVQDSFSRSVAIRC